MPDASESNCTAVFFNVVLPLLFISASTPATAMYINPPAVNPCEKGGKKNPKNCELQAITIKTNLTNMTPSCCITSIKDDCPGSFPQSKAYKKKKVFNYSAYHLR